MSSERLRPEIAERQAQRGKGERHNACHAVKPQGETTCAVQYDHEEIQEMLGRSFAVQDDIDEDELLGELDLIEDEIALEADAVPATGVPAFLEEPDLPAAPTATANMASPGSVPERLMHT
jgi:hypothetical protein